jgi:nucleotide-binding universal stress UspA family protein
MRDRPLGCGYAAPPPGNAFAAAGQSEVLMKRILVPLDGSRVSEGALPHVHTLAHSNGAEVFLLRVVTGPADLHPTPTGQMHHGHDASEEHCRAYLNAVAATFTHEHIKTETLVAHGNPAHVILHVAKDMHADLIVMSTYGRGGLKRTLIGSVADHVIRHASAPVLVTRPHEHEPAHAKVKAGHAAA